MANNDMSAEGRRESIITKVAKWVRPALLAGTVAATGASIANAQGSNVENASAKDGHSIVVPTIPGESGENTGEVSKKLDTFGSATVAQEQTPVTETGINLILYNVHPVLNASTQAHLREKAASHNSQFISIQEYNDAVVNDTDQDTVQLGLELSSDLQNSMTVIANTKVNNTPLDPNQVKQSIAYFEQGNEGFAFPVLSNYNITHIYFPQENNARVLTLNEDQELEFALARPFNEQAIPQALPIIYDQNNDVIGIAVADPNNPERMAVVQTTDIKPGADFQLANADGSMQGEIDLQNVDYVKQVGNETITGSDGSPLVLVLIRQKDGTMRNGYAKLPAESAVSRDILVSAPQAVLAVDASNTVVEKPIASFKTIDGIVYGLDAEGNVLVGNFPYKESRYIEVDGQVLPDSKNPNPWYENKVDTDLQVSFNGSNLSVPFQVWMSTELSSTRQLDLQIKSMTKQFGPAYNQMAPVINTVADLRLAEGGDQVLADLFGYAINKASSDGQKITLGDGSVWNINNGITVYLNRTLSSAQIQKTAVRNTEAQGHYDGEPYADKNGVLVIDVTNFGITGDQVFQYIYRQVGLVMGQHDPLLAITEGPFGLQPTGFDPEFAKLVTSKSDPTKWAKVFEAAVSTQDVTLGQKTQFIN